MKVLVTGAAGQLARAVAARFSRRAEVVALSRTDLDIADEGAVRAEAVRQRPDVIVNCAAFNDVDGAEDRAVDALLVNAFGVLSLARAAADTGATLVHYGTDFIFDGEAERPYLETDPVMPQSQYGLSKLLGEFATLGLAGAQERALHLDFRGLRPAQPRRAQQCPTAIAAGQRMDAGLDAHAHAQVVPDQADVMRHDSSPRGAVPSPEQSGHSWELSSKYVDKSVGER